MKNVEILTSNAVYENGECVGGYHEIHKINYLQNVQHLIATVDSIIKNNLLYGCDDTVLEDVTVSCDDQKVVDEVNKHYNGRCGKVKVYVETSYAVRNVTEPIVKKGKIMRKPKVENKYNLKPKDIQKAIILDYERLKQPPFWRNDVVQAWCLSDGSGRGYYGGHIDSYWIGFYDKNAKAYAGKIRLSCTSYEDMCNYNFKKFFDYDEIENEVDLELQEKLLSRINWLIDEGIIEISKE